MCHCIIIIIIDAIITVIIIIIIIIVIVIIITVIIIIMLFLLLFYMLKPEYRLAKHENNTDYKHVEGKSSGILHPSFRTEQYWPYTEVTRHACRPYTLNQLRHATTGASANHWYPLRTGRSVTVSIDIGLRVQQPKNPDCIPQARTRPGGLGRPPSFLLNPHRMFLPLEG